MEGMGKGAGPALAVLAALALGACAILPEEVIRPPQFERVDEPRSEIRLFGPTQQHPLGGAAFRIWSRVENPNGFGVTLTRVEGDLFLEGARAAAVSLPLGLPLVARRDTIIPLELRLGFADLPGLAETALRAVTGAELGYRLDGTVSVDAGILGEPTFGPMTLMQGGVVVVR
jgi:hypothetical protein